MAWNDDLQPASWRSIPFVVSSDPTRAVRQIALHGRRQAAPAFAVRRNDLAGLAPRAASYVGQPVNLLLR